MDGLSGRDSSFLAGAHRGGSFVRPDALAKRHFA